MRFLRHGSSRAFRERFITADELQRLIQCVDLSIPHARAVDQIVLFILNMQTCLIVGGLKNPHLEDAAIARIHCPGVVIFAVKIAAGRMKTFLGKPFTEGFAIFGGRRFFKPALRGVIAGNLYGRFLRSQTA